ncbi:protein-S-isoprenylcysteine O-methyltransferase [Parasphingorhabdus cellanae]|uniref:Isoprenylcysteine carboxylmethyltransferase family protein n=1 Tax=Parasphingorhabdus cellanae TaxID=2806553 RepID=A0ABX7T5I8_9SPHN|nr:protein-S-isoprenylcysteine O-methyltransferase [Parasphingorhabdus cellanae]QTD56806.1 isoprenylcysteine carboxylmethyltransferase family protein [Parasphingorhabdus cellanae]
MSKPEPDPIFGKIIRLVITIMGLGLLVMAVLNWQTYGWGALVWIGAMIGQTIIRVPHARRNAQNTIVQDKKDVQEQVLLTAMFLTMALFPLLHIATGLFAFADYALPTWATTIGFVMQVLFLWLFWRSHSDLGQNWSATLEVRDEHNLVTEGVYARIRHPMYTAIWLAALSQPLLIHNWIAGALVILAFAVMCVLRIPREETMMRDIFGAEYENYILQTGRLIPKL